MKNQQNNQIVWSTLALMAFSMVWGFGNVVNNFAEQRLAVVFSWLVIMAIYFVPYALMVGELGSAYPQAKGGVSSWLAQASWRDPKKGLLLAYLAGWTYWVVHIPYLAQKPQAAMVAFSWVIKQDASLIKSMDTIIVQAIILGIFLLFMFIASRGITSLKSMGYITGMSTLVLSGLYVVLAIAAPVIRDVPIATENLFKVSNFLPQFGLEYFGTIAMLVFAVGGAEKISPYVRNMQDPARGFPKAMIALALMVGLSAVTGSIAMAMMFDANNLSNDMLMNGDYDAFLRLGEHYGLGKSLVVIYAITRFISQVSVLMFSIDAPLKVLLLDADSRYIPKSLTKVNDHGAPIHGYIMTAILVGLVIMLPALGIKNMNDLYNWLLRLNSVVMPMRYMWVFFAYVILRNAFNKERSQGSAYRFIKNDKFARLAGWWTLAFTAFACLLGAIPKGSPESNPDYYTILALNIFFPLLLMSLGFIMPMLARRETKS